MKSELEAKLTEILAAIQAGVAKGADFALEQLPDVAQQYLLYGRVWSVAFALAWLVTLALFLWVALKMGYLSKAEDCYGDWSIGRLIAALLGTFGAVLAAFMVLGSFRDVALVWLAPKVWLLKEVAGLLR